MALYHELAERFRTRITSGEWHVGTQLPSISELQDEYDIRSLNTVRFAQQLLVEEGMLETRRGIGAFVVGVEPLTSVDVQDELAGIRDRLTTILAAMESQRLHRFTVDLDDPAEPHVLFVLTEALREWAGALRDLVAKEPEIPNGSECVEWAETAERLLLRVEEAV